MADKSYIDAADLFAGPGEVRALARDLDWSATSLGAPATWSPALRTAALWIFDTPVPVCLWAGSDYALLYNDAYRRILSAKHPAALGQPGSVVWAEIWEQLEPQFDQVRSGGAPLYFEDAPFVMARLEGGGTENAWFSYSLSALRDEDGTVSAVLNISPETTARVQADAALKLSETAARTDAQRVQLALAAGAIVGTWFWDLPTDRFSVDAAFALAFGLDPALGHHGIPLEQIIATVHPDDREGLEAAINEAIARGGPYAHQYRVRRVDGQYHWIEANGRVEHAADGTPLRFPGVLLDISGRKAADDARAASEARLRLVVEGAKDHAILTTDTDGVVTSWSAGAEAIFGWSSDEMVGHPVALMFTPEDRAAGIDVEELRTAAVSGCANDERWHLRKDGSRVFMNGSVHPLPDGSDGASQGFLKIARHETQRRRTDEALRQLNADLERQVIERSSERGTTWQVSPFMLSVVDLTTGCFIRVNPAWANVLGYTPEEIVGRSYLEFLHPDDVARTMEGYAQVESGQPILDFENRYRAKAGDYRWLKWVAVPEGGKLYSTVRDVTAEKAAAAERDRIFEITRDLVGVASFDGDFVSINPAWAQALGRPHAEILARPFAEIIHPDDLAVTGDVVATLMAGQPAHQFHVRLLKADGDPVSYAWSATPDLERGLFYTVGRDITDEIAAAVALRETQDALRQSQKMEAVGQLTGGIAHDFNNLLAGIAGSLELMQKRITDQGIAGFDRHMGIAQTSTQRAASLTQRLLAFARRQTLDPKPVDVNRLISGVEDLFRRSVGPNIEIAVVGAVGLWPTKIDAPQLENALLNLVINARDAMPDGGRITIETANKWIDARAAKDRDLTPGQYVSVCVTDTGAGMTPEVIERAFDPFYTTKPLGQGTGLGLSMIHGFVRQSGGQVRIYSEVDQGTTMCLYLPRFTGELEADDNVTPVEELEPGQGETVLIIDDEEAIRMLVNDVLGEAGYRVLEADDGPSGLRILNSESRIDLLITDVGLPGGFNGRQVADAARQARPDLKVLFITGYADNAVIGNGHLDPGMQVITKPFPITALAQRVREIIEG